MVKTPKPRSIKETLKRAYGLIRNKSRWTWGSFAEDRDGNSLDSGASAKAVRFCALGAIQRVDGPYKGQAFEVLRSSCIELYRVFTIPDVNDGPNGRKRILKAFKHAIKSCR